MENKNVVTTSTLPLTTIGLITFIVFAILKWGTHSIDWPNFWIWFPLWLPWAIEGVFVLLIMLIIKIFDL